jgi:hypothetical protein
MPPRAAYLSPGADDLSSTRPIAALFAGMGVSPATAMRGLLDPELPLAAPWRVFARVLEDDPLDGAQVGDFAHGDVEGTGTVLRSGPTRHHRADIARQPAAFRDEYRLPRVVESRFA